MLQLVRGVDIISFKNIKLLIIEDSLCLKEMLLYIFANLGIHVETVTTVSQAISLLNIYIPHLIICDIELPAQTGYKFIQKLKIYENKYQVKIPVIAISALNDEIEKNKALKAGFSEFLGKPFDYELLVEKVYQLVEIDSYFCNPSIVFKN